ncbi:MAG: peptidylprolyl isomerase [Bryobacteraceae bacterium]|nr:peptidyl-prolyl cis-trans isomerase [Bryobacterales bacterium]MEB2362188.1 peptidyl-prolyl cis-trans isomerase [Bryobacterales bacterium]NUM99807.1 peptidylprolyl isomerase [Bryobacteraceae bacterium]
MKFLRFLLVTGVVSASAAAADAILVDEIIAKVNGEIITRSELERTRRQMEGELKQRGVNGAQLKQALQERERDLLRDRIDQMLLVQRAKQMDINVDAEVSKYLAEVQLQTKIAQPEKFHEFIRQQLGMPYEDYRAEIRNSMMTQRVIRQEVGDRIRIPRSDLEKYYNEHKDEFVRKERIFLREILVSTEGKDAAGVAAAEKKAKDLVARARKGERFGELARDNSDAESAAQMGELPGWEKGQLDKELEAIVWDKERGYVTDPIRRPNGFLILRVEEHHKAGLAPFEEVENEIMEKLYMPLFQPRVREFLTRLRTEAFLEIREGYVDTSAAPGKDTSWSDPAELRPETVTKEEVLNQPRRKRLLWLIPIPGTKSTPKPKE